MPFAHGAPGGPNFEALVLALAMVVVGVILFVQKTAKPIVPVVLVLGGIGIAAGGLTIFAGDDHEEDLSPAGGNQAYVGVVTGLCEAAAAAATEPEDAERIFQDQVHVPLHELAAEVGEADRAVAARLLEAKDSVESALEAPPIRADALEDDLSELLDATIAGVRTIEMEAPTC